MGSRGVRRNILQRIFGISATRVAMNESCWSYSKGEVTVDLGGVPELSSLGSGVRLEGRGLPERVLLVRGVDGIYRAFRNQCAHGGRRVDPCPQEANVQCCSIGRALYDYSGNLLEGPAKGPLVSYPVEVDGEKLTIRLEG
jgi:nitrite reductase/ring-hydroxylating ferredoxin subunit